MQGLQFPLSTGQVCRLLETAEHRVINPIRQGKVHVPNIGGRRLWSASHVLTVARIIGRDTIEIRELVTAAQKVEAAK